MSAMSTSDWAPDTLGPQPRDWTTDDLDAMTEDGVRRELIDGVLHVTPSPAPIHQTLAALLTSALYQDCPAEYAVTQGVEVRISRRRSFIPDVQIVTAEANAANSCKFAPEAVLVAVEIVSPSSVSMDNVLKPALYAAAGIPHYWKIDLTPELKASTFDLNAASGVYEPTGEFTDILKVDAPWPITLPFERFRPRGLA